MNLCSLKCVFRTNILTIISEVVRGQIVQNRFFNIHTFMQVNDHVLPPYNVARMAVENAYRLIILGKWYLGPRLATLSIMRNEKKFYNPEMAENCFKHK